MLQNLAAGFHLFVKVPDSWTRIKDPEGNECSRHFGWGAAVPTSQPKHFCQGVCQWKSRSQRWDILQCDSSEIVIVIVGFLVASALETLRFTRTNIPVCCCRVVWILQCGRLFLFVVNWTSRSYFFRADDPQLASYCSFQDESNTDLFASPSKTDFY